jgi:hypothetical protein
MLATDILGVHVPDSRPVFLAFVGVHIVAGLTSAISGGLAATARKRPGRHPRAGTVYLWGIAGLFATAAVLAGMRWSHSWHLFIVGTVAFGLALLGWQARRRRRHRWMLWHGSAMGGSYIALFTGFYVDNGPQLPLWNRLPPVSYWFIPAAVGIPLIVRALIRNGALSTMEKRPSTMDQSR